MPRGKFRPNVVNWRDVGREGSFPNADPAFHDYVILAEGDSWFTIGGIPTSNLLFSIRFRKAILIVHCAEPGDTIEHMSEMSKNRAYKEALAQQTGLAWDMVLLSGGGNDLIDEVDEILISAENRGSPTMSAPADYCDQSRLDRLIADVQDGYRRMVAIRDKEGGRARGKPVVTHTYDYVTPRNSPARFIFVPVLGPWLYKAVKQAQIPKEDWLAVSDYLVDRLADGILALTKGRDRLSNFHVVDTRGTLKRAKLGTVGESGDWMNEIHPDFDGYAKIAKAMETKVSDLLPSG